jgi:tetratricopeptide (TPR) repeat protein
MTRAFLLCVWIACGAIARAWQPDRTALRHLFEQALTERRVEYGPTDPQTAQAARDLGLFLQRSGDAASARTALAEAVRIDDVAPGKTAPQTLEDVASLAAVSPPAQAEPLLRRAAESTDPAVSGPALSNLANLRKTAGDHAGAVAYLRRALEKAELADGKDGTIVALILNELAMNVDAKEAIGYLDRALSIDRSKLGERDPETILTEINLSRVLLAAGRVDEAIAMARESLNAAEVVLGTSQPETAAAANALGHALQTKGDRIAAERLYREALSIDRNALGPRDSRTRKDARDLAAILRQNGKAAEAATLDAQFNAAPAK